MSNSVSKALTLTGGPDVKKTAEFCEMFDKFFDCMNVSNFTDGNFSRKSFKDPYYSGTNFRLKVLAISYVCTLITIIGKIVAQRRLSGLFEQMGGECV